MQKQYVMERRNKIAVEERPREDAYSKQQSSGIRD